MTPAATIFIVFLGLAALQIFGAGKYECVDLLKILVPSLSTILFLISLVYLLHHRKWKMALIMPCFLFFLTLELMSTAALLANGQGLSLEAIYHISPANIWRGLRLFPLPVFICGSAYVVLIAVAWFGMTRPIVKAPSRKYTFFLLTAGLVLLYFHYPHTHLLGPIRNSYHMREIHSLDPAFYRKQGIKISGVSKYDVRADSGKNLVFIYLESIDSGHCSEKDFPGLTPNLNRLRAEGLCFTNIGNAENAFLTFGGMFASQTGTILTSHHLNFRAWNMDFNPEIGARFASFPWILKQAGYHQVYMMGPEVSFAQTNKMLFHNGFDEVFSVSTNHPSDQVWGCSDQELFERALTEYRRLVRQGKPFHLMLATIDTHGPDGFLNPGSIRYAKEGAPDLMHAIHTTDHHLGRFIDQLKQEPGWEETCVFINSDHLSPATSLASILEKIPDRRHISFALNTGRQGEIDQPGHTCDIAPTVLELLNVKHNYTFPVGENLLYPANRARLDKSSLFHKALTSYTLFNSEMVNSPNQRVKIHEAPLRTIDFNHYKFMLFRNDEPLREWPDTNECLVLCISEEGKILKSDFYGEQNIRNLASESSQNSYLILGHTSGPAGALVENCDDKQWILAFGRQKQWSFCTGDDPVSLEMQLLWPGR